MAHIPEMEHLGRLRSWTLDLPLCNGAELLIL